jgi:hypothetical protein
LFAPTEEMASSAALPRSPNVDPTVGAQCRRCLSFCQRTCRARLNIWTIRVSTDCSPRSPMKQGGEIACRRGCLPRPGRTSSAQGRGGVRRRPIGQNSRPTTTRSLAGGRASCHWLQLMGELASSDVQTHR